LNYREYLEIEALLTLQHPKSDPVLHDEHMFIVTHQVYELWFSVLIHELDSVRGALFANRIDAAMSLLKRCMAIMKTLLQQIEVLHTLTPISFNTIRRTFGNASGIQSAQFHEIEFILGMKEPAMLAHFKDDANAVKSLQRRLDEPSVADALLELIKRRDPNAADNGKHAAERDSARTAIQHLYVHDEAVRNLFEKLIDLDTSWIEWRHKHYMLAQRMIGQSRGTGGTAGAAFLAKRLFRSAFNDLWAARDLFTER
jgi:tryptophan 2,3-dioxygenase